MQKRSSTPIRLFINGLFGTDYPPESTVEYPNTEQVGRKLKRIMSDTMIIIGGIHVYHVEAQIGDDENIAVRVFEYGYAEGLRTHAVTDDLVTLKFPAARIIYWETTNKTPNEVTLRLEFPDGNYYDYKVKTFKPLNYTIAELKERKMAILLPFYVLKLRKRVVRAKSPEERRGLAVELKALIDDLVETAEKSRQEGVLDPVDYRFVIEYLDRLISELYSPYTELEEADVMLKKQILTYSEEAALKAKEEGRREGLQEGKQAVAQKMKQAGLPESQIAEFSGLKPEEIRKL
jgi:hypothetical protein